MGWKLSPLSLPYILASSRKFPPTWQVYAPAVKVSRDINNAIRWKPLLTRLNSFPTG